MALRLLHFADLHLDRSFASERLFGVPAQRRREDLRASLTRIVQRARDESVDLITCAGDLFEHEHVTKDTGNFVAQTLGEAGRPVLIAPGHSDPALPGSPYRYLRWPANVTLCVHEELRPYQFGPVAIWSSGYMRPAVTEAPLRDFTTLTSGINLLLLHASDMSALPEGTVPLKPLTPDQVREAGFRHALLGHYHGARSNDLITYPGSAQPFAVSDGNRHCTALVTVQDDGQVEVALDEISDRRPAGETIDITGMTSREQLIEAVRAGDGMTGQEGLRKLTLVGQRSPALEVDPGKLAALCGNAFSEMEVEDRSQLSHDLEAVAQEFTSRGEMVRKLVERRPDSVEDRQAVGRALQLALDAFEQ